MEKEEILFKQRVFDLFEQVVCERVDTLQKMLEELVLSTKNETKSSAGDKYETARAMLQIEQDNVRKQLTEALHQKALFTTIERRKVTSHVAKGSLVKTNKGYFLVGIGLGKIQIDGNAIIAVSPQSPLGSKLLGMKTMDIVTINGIEYNIEKII